MPGFVTACKNELEIKSYQEQKSLTFEKRLNTFELHVANTLDSQFLQDNKTTVTAQSLCFAQMTPKCHNNIVKKQKQLTFLSGAVLKNT